MQTKKATNSKYELVAFSLMLESRVWQLPIMCLNRLYHRELTNPHAYMMQRTFDAYRHRIHVHS